jgi:hypothetical protein
MCVEIGRREHRWTDWFCYDNATLARVLHSHSSILNQNDDDAERFTTFRSLLTEVAVPRRLVRFCHVRRLLRSSVVRLPSLNRRQ